MPSARIPAQRIASLVGTFSRPSPSPRPSFLPRRSFASCPALASHVGSAPIPLPAAVTFVPPSAASSPPSARAVVRGPKGELVVDVAPFVRFAVEGPSTAAGQAPSTGGMQLSVAVDDATVKHQRAVWGLTRSLLANAVTGVSEGYTLPLRLVGVGYRAAVEPVKPSAAQLDSALPPSVQRLNLKLGFAHPVLIDLPTDVKASTPSPTSIVLEGIDKQRLGQVAARIRSWRIPEPYNGKGIFVGDEQVRRKEVKKK
ncbi:hypothetical protein JCM6882_003371 [Rhodosporidiobolus microsporus]